MSATTAVLIPCFNEEPTIGRVVREFRDALPEADVYVYDNRSTDGTAEEAERAGAKVRFFAQAGKGKVVRRMLMDVDADYYLIVDGDGTYPAAAAREMLSILARGEADMVVGTRLERHGPGSFRRLHKFGNMVITGLINVAFGARVSDVLSGYRAFTRTFARTIPMISKGFEIETEMTLNALDASMVIREMPIDYAERPAGSDSKLSTYRDGFLILFTIVVLLKDYRPLLFFSSLFALCALLGALSGVPVLVEFGSRGTVSRIPLAVFSAIVTILAFQFLSVGVILDTIARNRRAQQEIWRKNAGRPPH